jgi:hypothetical protein
MKRNKIKVSADDVKHERGPCRRASWCWRGSSAAGTPPWRSSAAPRAAWETPRWGGCTTSTQSTRSLKLPGFKPSKLKCDVSWFHFKTCFQTGGSTCAAYPSGKSAERPVLDDATINANTAAIQKTLEGVLANSARMAAAGGADVPAAKVMNNLDWFGSMVGSCEYSTR